MLRLDIDTEPGGVSVRWRVGRGLSLHRRDGTLIMHINADYADERALMTAAHALNFMFRTKNAHATTKAPSSADTRNIVGDGAKT